MGAVHRRLCADALRPPHHPSRSATPRSSVCWHAWPGALGPPAARTLAPARFDAKLKSACLPPSRNSSLVLAPLLSNLQPLCSPP
eukprot:64312-Chlamydomonas_euryale.AAC.1